MAAVRQGRPTVELACPVCFRQFTKEKYEAERNDRLGRANLCGRKCHAIYMNKSEAKIESVRNQPRQGCYQPGTTGGHFNTTSFKARGS